MIIDHIIFIGCYSEKECEDVQRPTSSCEGACVLYSYLWLGKYGRYT